MEASSHSLVLRCLGLFKLHTVLPSINLVFGCITDLYNSHGYRTGNTVCLPVVSIRTHMLTEL